MSPGRASLRIDQSNNFVRDPGDLIESARRGDEERSVARNISAAGEQLARFVVDRVDPDRVGRIENRLMGAVVQAQRTGGHVPEIRFGEPVHVIRRSSPEEIDRLVGVANDTDVALVVRGKELNQHRLGVICVLEFVDEQIAETLMEDFRDVGSLQQLDGHRDLVTVVDSADFLFLPFINRDRACVVCQLADLVVLRHRFEKGRQVFDGLELIVESTAQVENLTDLALASVTLWPEIAEIDKLKVDLVYAPPQENPLFGRGQQERFWREIDQVSEFRNDRCAKGVVGVDRDPFMREPERENGCIDPFPEFSGGFVGKRQCQDFLG